MTLCKVCKWWRPDKKPPYGEVGWGECELVGRNGGNRDGDWHTRRLAMTYGTGTTSDSGLRTHETFGCVQAELS